VARTVGHLLGKAQRYVADVKAEVNRSIELDELKKMKTQFEDAARDVEQTVNNEIHATVRVQATGGSHRHRWATTAPSTNRGSTTRCPRCPSTSTRRRTGASSAAPHPQWYKQRNGIRTKAQSGAARVARFRPPGLR
jgi:sec-independent protein translocase protein TatB